MKWQQGISIKVNGLKGRKMVQVFTYLPMVMFMKVNLKTEIDKDKAVILGLIKVIIRVNGWQIK